MTVRNPDRCPQVYADAGDIEETFAARRTTAGTDVGYKEYEPLRQATPTEMPLRRTLTWAAMLPDDVLPTTLICRYTRVTDLIAAAWEDPKAFRDCMESLLSDRRADRRGFPPNVLGELAALQRYYDAMDRRSSWDSAGKRG